LKRIVLQLTRMESSNVAGLPEFPVWALQPRTETGATQFVTKHPEYDGRGIIIAIFDSGVDPGSGGMQVTSDGKPKILERIDCSGAGDVDMSMEVTRDVATGCVEGVTGRKLRIPDEWDAMNAGGSYRVGVKRAFDLYPKSLRDRITKERQEKMWNPSQRDAVAATAAKLVEHEAKVKADKAAPPLTGMDKLAKENLDQEMEALNALDKTFKDNTYQGDQGPIYDVLAFHDGNHWNVVIDTSEEGDLEHGVRLRPYSETRDFAALTDADLLNVSVNIYDDGKVVQLVTVSSSHGTHVASMAAANFPEAPEKNGLAPGAQIISLTIGDGRLQGMETGTALSRAMTYVMQRNSDPNQQRIDAINMSYGEYSHFSSSGRVGELMAQVINKYGVVWMASAGNDGPALCTVGTPPDISTNTVIGVGAYVSPEMMVALYSSREKLPGTPYTWTSRGPTIDGDRGVTICAPGGAITSVPPYNLRCSQLMNGTSMASPHVCGAVAILLSGLKSRSLKWTPFSVKRALAATAKPVPNMCPYGQGNGLLQINDAFAHLVKYSDGAERDVRFSILCNAGNTKGIHLRDVDLSKPVEVPVKITPVYLNEQDESNERKAKFNMKFALACDDSVSWVKHPQFLDLMYTTRLVSVMVDPTSLPPGVHSAYVKGYDTACPDKGAIFEIPIHVVIPEPIVTSPRPAYIQESVTFQPNQMKRHFVTVPDKATWAVINIKSREPKAVGKFVLHTIQVIPKTIVKQYENWKMITLNENEEVNMSIAVKGGVVLEVCLAKYWANLGTVEASYSVTFHGIHTDKKELVLHGAHSYTRINLSGALAGSEEVSPDISLKTCVQNYRPSEAEVVPLGSRDVIPPSRTLYELQLTYSFTVSKATEICPDLSLLSDVLYESEFESQLWLLYNSHKQLVGCGDAYPNRYSLKVNKDDYTLRAHVRHEKRELLEKMTEMPMALGVKLPSSLSLDAYSSFAQASTGGKKVSSIVLNQHKTVPLFVTAPSWNDKQVKGAMVGQYLKGTMTLSKDEHGKKSDVIPVTYILNEASKRDKSGKSGSGSGGKKETPSYAEEMFEHKVKWLAGVDSPASEALSTEVYQELLKEDEKKAAKVHAARLQSLKLDTKPSMEDATSEKAEEVIKVADKVLSEVGSVNDILAFFAVKNNDLRPTQPTGGDGDSVSAETVKKDMEKKKGWYIEAMAKKGLALCVLDRLDEANECLFNCLQFNVEVTDAKVWLFATVHAEKSGHYGRALKIIQNQLDDKPNNQDLHARLSYIYDKLGWVHASKAARLAKPNRFPSSYDLF